MNCDEFRQLAQAIARDETLDATTLESAFSHADSCEPCDSLLEESEALTGELRSLAAYYAAEEAPRRVESLLNAVVQQQRDREAAGPRGGQWLSATVIGIAAEIARALRRRSTTVVAVAATLVLALALSGQPKTLWHPAWIANLAHSGETSVASGTSPEPLLASQTAVLDAEQNADSFVPLSGDYDLASLNDDPIVRVVLSDNDLESLGLPVGDSGDEQVVADLIIANDGTPRAIRVVSW
jgi:hypothetical protein